MNACHNVEVRLQSPIYSVDCRPYSMPKLFSHTHFFFIHFRQSACNPPITNLKSKSETISQLSKCNSNLIYKWNVFRISISYLVYFLSHSSGLRLPFVVFMHILCEIVLLLFFVFFFRFFGNGISWNTTMKLNWLEWRTHIEIPHNEH